MSKPDLFLLDDTLWVLTTPTGVPVYDFDFRASFPCRTRQPPEMPEDPQERSEFFQRPFEFIKAVFRIGAFGAYDTGSVFGHLMDTYGLVANPINSFEERFRCSQLPRWYPLVADLTPRSKCYDYSPSVAEVGTDFGWPLCLQGAGRASHHQREFSIIDGPDAFHEAMRLSQQDRILRSQPIVVRELVLLRAVEDSLSNRIPNSFAFRTFWWRGELVGSGRCWWEGQPYDWNEKEKAEGLAVAQRAVTRLGVPFVVIDIAQTIAGRWIVTDCNDGQDSEYAGASPLGIWQSILNIERQLKDKPA